ncbi:AAA family ATPase [Nonomuraea ferruginea]
MSPVFVGRQEQLTALADAFAEAGAGNATAVLLGGEAGVGKTRLVQCFAEQVARDGARVLGGGCVELSTEGLAYAPFTAVLRQLVREHGTGGIAALLPDGAERDLARLLPEFGEPSGDGETETGRARLFEQILTLLERLADDTPHRPDRRGHPLGRPVQPRPDRLPQPQPAGPAGAAGHDVPLRRPAPPASAPARAGRAGPGQRRAQARPAPAVARGGRPADGSASSAAPPDYTDVEKVYERSEGIPLFVEAMLESGEDLAFPESMQDLILNAVERLPEETQRVLRVAAAGGTRVGHALLSAVSGLSELELEAALRPAIA